MKTKSKGVTRRLALASALTAGPAVAVAVAQPMPQQPVAADDVDAAARERVKSASAMLRKLQVPIAIEPAFVFRA